MSKTGRALRQGILASTHVGRKDTGAYRLHVGTFPRPTLALPCGGAPNAALPVRGLGDGEPLPFTAELRDDGDGFARCFPSGASGTAPTPLLLRAGGPVRGD